MGELDSGNGAVLLDEPGEPSKWANVPIIRKAEIPVRDTAIDGDSGCLDDDHSKAAKREAAVMNEVVVVSKPIYGRVLAHGCGNQPVLECQPTK
jgi:hypothetical protein